MCLLLKICHWMSMLLRIKAKVHTLSFMPCMLGSPFTPSSHSPPATLYLDFSESATLASLLFLVYNTCKISSPRLHTYYSFCLECFSSRCLTFSSFSYIFTCYLIYAACSNHPMYNSNSHPTPFPHSPATLYFQSTYI
jgi:hypothetical protein